MKCPNCGNKLRIVGATDVVPSANNHLSNEDTCIEVMFNCNVCTCDYKVELLLSSELELSPIYWG
jgi:hypothetical protein